ncbi:ABC transporter substrate-binding protein [Undibacterium sp. SXout7W]|uniref:ABC transporter substrate-binding protein n=1 Tax=Undibacterium sp. SXout7W TaxID=3413049 RepID=UPI003BEF954B
MNSNLLLSKTLFASAITALTLGMSTLAVAQAPAGYPADYNKIIDAAKKEGKIVIYSATDTKAVEPLIKDFRVMYPEVQVEYNDMNSTEVFSRYISEMAAGGNSADLLWSSAMDLQVKLVSDGYGLQYASPEISGIPQWAIWNNSAFGTTFEPAVFVYNKRLVSEDEVPKTHAEFAKLINTKLDKFKNKVTTYDIEKSGVGFMFITQDSHENKDFWELAKAFGNASVRVQSSTGTMLERISSGENLIGYNILGSYALTRAAKDPSIGVQMPKDYTLVLSRVAFISKSAKHPNAGKLWLDYILSKRGQTIIANEANLFAIRPDVKGDANPVALGKKVGAGLKPLPVNPSLLQYLDQTKRLAFLKQWKETAGKK